jgi:uncharacterized membrane protein YedE/YeeE
MDFKAKYQPGTRQTPQPGENLLTRPRWNPYLVGALIGVLSWVGFYVVNKPIGMSTQIAAASAVAAAPVLGSQAVHQNVYWSGPARPSWDYGMLFLIGTFIGAGLAALVSRSWRIETVPAVWRERFGAAPAWRYLAALLGGAVLLYGARMAGGCTSGHGISGTLQLALSSWLFFVVMFIAGAATAAVMFGIPALGGARSQGGAS